MEIFEASVEHFNIRDTLDCGQIFRYVPENAGYRIFSGEHVCEAHECDGKVFVRCDSAEYFKAFFDLGRDYREIYSSAIGYGNEFLCKAAECGKGIRILRQDTEEMLFSFIVSQNNNIPRIKGIIERLCSALGKRREFCGKSYFTFPKAAQIAQKSEDFYKSIGLGYRAAYLPSVANALLDGFDINFAKSLSTPELKRELVKLKGVGPKVADCVALFGFGRADSFPVDTWIEKIYREDFNGKLSDRRAITEFFTDAFGENSGYFQQYMFHYKRNVLSSDSEQ
ncbi:MAG: DNA-3-methyladenine glycosylase 2 family protein [Clostridia bacterium]|nr:DNA-3-methyladenine glycosylase 2 family protein [Clostridia bacterium]